MSLYMESAIDTIAHQISEHIEEIERCKQEITRLRGAIRVLSYQAIEIEDGEISHFDDIT
jgi:peptidoglycan hydrolase CwlO-like protein